MALTPAQQTDLKTRLQTNANGWYTGMLDPGSEQWQPLTDAVNTKRPGVLSQSATSVLVGDLKRLIDQSEVSSISADERWYLDLQLAGAPDASIDIAVGSTLRAGLQSILGGLTNTGPAITAFLTQDASEFEQVVGELGQFASRSDVIDAWRNG